MDELQQYQELPTTVPQPPESTVAPMVVFGIYGVLLVVLLAAMWRIFTKAGKPGWASLVPIYNTYIMLQIVGRPGWWLLLMLIPLVNIVISLIVAIDMAKAFKRSEAFGILALWLFPLVGMLMLGFGKSTYAGPPNIPTKPNPAPAQPQTPAAPPPPQVS